MKSKQKFDYEFVCKAITILYICSIYALIGLRTYIEAIWICVFLLLFISKKIKITKYFWWSISFLGICIFSNLWSSTPIDTLYATRGVIEVIVIGNLLVAFIDTEEKIQFILKCFVIAGIALSFRMLITTPLSSLLSARIGNDFYNSNSIGLNLSVSAICGLYFARTSAKLKKMYFVLIPVFFIIIYLTGSRKAFLFSTLGCLMMYIFTVKQKSKLVFILPITAIVGYLFYYCIMVIPAFHILAVRISYFVNLLTGSGPVDSSATLRVQLIDAGIRLWKSKPLFGYGIQSFSTISGMGMYAHNNYIELLVGVGVIGLVIYYSIYIYIVVKLGKKVFQGENLAIPFYILIILIMINEIGFVSYGEELFQIIIAMGVACIRVFSERQHINILNSAGVK